MNTKRGRPRKKVNPAAFMQEKAAFQLREITAEKAAENLGIGRATFFPNAERRASRPGPYRSAYRIQEETMNTKRKLKQTRKQAKREPAPILPAEMLRRGLQNMKKDLAWFACDAREFDWKQMKLAAARRRGNIHGRM